MSDTTGTSGLTQRVADYALRLRFEAVSAKALDRTKQLLLDFLGVALGGVSYWPAAPAMLHGVRSLAVRSDGASTVVGQSKAYRRQDAALLNGALAHSMDFDDTHAAAIMHIGTPLFPALLAAGEDASGAEFLTAAVAGYEVAGKLGMAHLDRVHLRGFHPTATTGIFAATAAAGRLLGSSADVVENALGLASSMAAGTQQFSDGGGANKPYQVGMAAQNAIVALLMAGAGVPGAARPLEGRFGYFAVFAEPGSRVDDVVLDLEAPSEVLRIGIKPYPCCRYSHGTIDGVREIVLQERLKPEDIEAIEVRLPVAGYRLVGAEPATKRRPPSLVEAQFSAYFAAAVAASDQPYSWDSYTRLAEPRLQQVMDRVTVTASESLTDMQTHVSVRAEGRTWSLDVPLPSGEPELPLSWGEIEAKFLALATPLLGHGRSVEVITRVHALETHTSMRELSRLLRPE
jgi:2-methylcitrate dehydratase PrpD